MAIFDRLTKEEIAEYPFEGMFCGCVPVYAKEIETEAPILVEKNWCPGWALEVVGYIFDFFGDLTGYEGGWPMRFRKNKLYKGNV